MVNPFLIIIPGFPVFSLTITYFNAYTATSEVIITFKCFPYILTRVNSTNSFIIPPPIWGRISIRQWQHISCGIIVQICVSCFEFGIGSHNKTIWRKESLNICIERRWERPQTILNFEYILQLQKPLIRRYTLLIYLSNRINHTLPALLVFTLLTCKSPQKLRVFPKTLGFFYSASSGQWRRLKFCIQINVNTSVPTSWILYTNYS